MVVALIGGLSTGTRSLYGTGLDFSSVFPRFSRVQASISIGVVAFLFILTGRIFFDLLGAVNAFVGAIIVTTTPWTVIMAIGYIVRRGSFRPRDLQVFNRSEIGGTYWFTNGINWRGMLAWLGAVALGLLFAKYPPIIIGPFINAGGVIDLSLAVAVVAGAVLHRRALWLIPEPRYVFGDDGPRGVPSRAGAPQAIEADHGSTAARFAARRVGTAA